MLVGPPGTEALVEALLGTDIIVVTGAGVSHASGMPLFRGTDPDAVWAKSIKTMGTRGYFERDPASSWKWYRDRFDLLKDKEPNPAHLALADIETTTIGRRSRFLLVTQNIDPLHEKAGSKAMVKVHGSADRARYSETGCVNGAPSGTVAMSTLSFAAFESDPVEANIPRCPVCAALMRPHVLWFDETYTEHASYEYERVCKAADRATAALFVGTSFAVGITETVVEACRGRAPVWSIDPSGRSPNADVHILVAKAEELLPRVAAHLR
jgi:NAD-dependent deacetylase